MELDDPRRIRELRALIARKPALRRFYEEVYEQYVDCLDRCPEQGIVVELGSGASFIKRYIPEVITSDPIPYEGVDQVIDATRMPFANNSVRAIFMLNVFHHIPDSEAFLKEAERVLMPGGRVFMRDQHVGWLSRIILKYAHHEPFDAGAQEWKFASTGPLSGANGALAWIVFMRDRERFERKFPSFRIARYEPNTPFRYWLAGGLKSWSLLPGFAVGAFTRVERRLVALHKGWSCFVDVELVRS
ncbi:MAG: class I SAM-dependent methyltransferase [Myxococcota bacterium]